MISLVIIRVAPLERCIETAMVATGSDFALSLAEWVVTHFEFFVLLPVGDGNPTVEWLLAVEVYISTLADLYS